MSIQKFRDAIENHTIFHQLEWIDVGDSVSDKPEQLMHIHDGSLYVWDNQNSCLNVAGLAKAQDHEDDDIQKLKCSPPPTFDVKRILFNMSGTLVALAGDKCAAVLILPERWRQSKQGSQTYCKCLPVAERFFRTSVSVKVLEAAWHPGSPGDNHLCLLLSDNTLRVFQTGADMQSPVQLHKLGQQSAGLSRFSLSSSRFSINSVTGEIVVSFDFARPVIVQEKSKTKLHYQKTNDATSAQLYPIYLLQGNGDILLLLTSCTDSRYRRGILQGPLVMKPPAEDNYGVDACSVLVLDCTPTVLAIATSSGRVHHCVALASDDDYDSEDDISESQSTRSWPSSVLSVKSKGASTEFIAPTLYVYETVELGSEINRDEEDRNFVDVSVALYRDQDQVCYKRECCRSHQRQVQVRMGRDLQSAMAVVKPYGTSDMTFFSRHLKTAGVVKRKSRDLHEMLKDYEDSKRSKAYLENNFALSNGDSDAGSLLSGTSILKFCSKVSNRLRLKEFPRHVMPQTTSRNRDEYHPPPPHNSFIEDPSCKLEPSTTESVNPTFNEAVSASVSRVEQWQSYSMCDLDKVCKMVPHLPNPVSRLLYDEMTSRKIKKSELKQLRKMPCYSEHIRHREPPCVTYFSPKPSQLLLHRSVDQLERDVDELRRKNSTSQAPLSTVEVFCKLSSCYTVTDLILRLLHFGDIEKMNRQNERLYRVVYRSLTGACRAVDGLKDDMNVFCSWHHRQLEQKKFIQMGQDPLKVLVYKF